MFSRYFPLKLIYFTKNENKLIIEQFPFTIFQNPLDKLLIEDRILQFPEVVL